jgi:hypothetical protein
LDSPERHSQTRTLVGSIHRIHNDISIVIYGLRLNAQHQSEIKLWGNTEYEDLKDFVVTSKVSRKVSNDEHNIEFWIPVIIQRAAQRYGTVLYIDSSFVLTGHLAPIQEILTKRKSYFVTSSGGDKIAPSCDSSIQGYIYDSFAYNNLLLPKINCYHKKCSKEQKGLLYQKTPPSISKKDRISIKCNEYPTQITNKIGDHGQDQCYIAFKDNFLFSHHQLPSFPKSAKSSNSKINIGILFI